MMFASTLCWLVIWFIRKVLPESARWLGQRGRHKEAHQVMSQMEIRCSVTPKADFPQDDATARLPQRGRFRETWAPEWRKRTLMRVVMNFFQAIGFFGFGNWLPALRPGTGSTVTHSMLYALSLTPAYPIGSLICCRYADTSEHKCQIDCSLLMPEAL